MAQGGQFPGGGDKPAESEGRDDSVTMLRAIAENLSQLVEATKSLNGGVKGPPVSVVGNIAIFDNTTGNLIADSGIAISTFVAVRTPLTANRTYFVRVDGNDANTGLVDSAGGAFLTVQHAVDIAYGTLDLKGFNVVIQVRDGTFARAVIASPQTGAGLITIQGNTVTPANVILTAALVSTTSGVIDVQNYAVLAVRDLTITGSGSGSSMFAGLGGVIYFQNVRFGTFTGGIHMLGSQVGSITATGNYAIVGAAAIHWWANDRGSIRVQSRTVTITGTPAFANAFVQADYAGIATVNGNTYSGSATGVRFNAANLGEVVAFGGLTELPGNAAGTVASNGVHPALVDYATDAQIRAASPKFVVTADNIETASAAVSLTDAGTVALDWDAGINFNLVIAGNRALGTPTNAQPGTYRTIRVGGNDGTLRTLSFAGYRGGTPTLIDITNAKEYLITIFSVTATICILKSTQAFP